jgi:hypothetical protein
MAGDPDIFRCKEEISVTHGHAITGEALIRRAPARE